MSSLGGGNIIWKLLFKKITAAESSDWITGIASHIYRYLPREVDPLVYNMSHEDPGDVSYSEIGGLSEQIRELREVHVSLLYQPVF